MHHAPAVMLRREKGVSRHDTFFAATPVPVVLSEPPSLIVSAGPGQPWKLFGEKVAPDVPAEHFADWNEPGWVKVAMQFRIAAANRFAMLSTETRIISTDAVTERRFAPYWAGIRLGSILIRREVVRRVAKAAERPLLGR